MDFRILGPLEVSDDGRAIDLGGARQRALLAILLLHRREVIPAERLADQLYGADPPPTAAKSLQAHVSRLRRALGANGKLETRSGGYVLDPDHDDVDADRFADLVEQGRRALDRGAAEDAAEALNAALGLWRGPPLADLTYEEFAQAEIGRLDELRLGCVEGRFEAGLTLGRHAELVGELEQFVSEHPLRERSRMQLMLALYRSDRQAEALAAYQEGRQTLVETLGIEPSPGLRDLERAILRQDASLAAPPTATMPSAGATTSIAADPTRSVLVGRETELHELLAGLDAAVAGRGGLILLAGEPGIGKSRLAEEVSRRALERDALVLVGRCWEAGGAPAYWPWVQSIRSYVEQGEPDAVRAELGDGAVEVAQIVPEVRRLVPGLPEPSAEGDDARFRLFDATTRFLRNAADARALVLVLDDLHAADEPSLLLLRFLAGQLGGSRMLVVGTYRDVDPTIRDPLATTLAELVREPVTRRLELGGLTEADVRRYIELSAGATPPPELVAAIQAETEGNALFVAEVVRLLAGEGRLADVATGARPALDIPQGVRDVIGRRLRRLSTECVGVLTLASILGREFGLDALERLAELPEDELLDVLDEAIAARVLLPVPAARGRLRFAHALFRETLYDELTPLRRARLHRRAGAVLEELYALDPDPHLAELAHHLLEAAPAGDVDQALEYAGRAAEQALALLAYEEAARFFELALQALALKPTIDPNLRCDLLLGLGEAQARAGNEDAGEAAFREAAEIARSTGAAERLAQAALGYGGRFVWMPRALGRDVVPLLEDALEGIGEADDPLRARLLARLAGALRDQPERSRRDELSAGAVAIARRLGDPSTLAYALDGRYGAVWRPDNSEERLAIAGEMLSLADDLGDAERAIQARFYRAIARLERGEMTAVHAELDVMQQSAAELRQPAQQWYATVLDAIVALFEGDFTRAAESIARNREVASTLTSYMPRGAIAHQMYMLDREVGRLDESSAVMERLAADHPTITVFRCTLAALYAELGRPADARAIVEALAETGFDVPVENDQLFAWSMVVEVCTWLGETAHAATLYSLLLPHAHLNAVCHPACAAGSVSRYLGLLAAMLERPDDAERHFEDAIDANARMGARPWLAQTRGDFARLLLTRDRPGDRERAHLLVAEALAAYEELGMPVASARTSELLATGQPPSSSPSQ